MIKLDFETIKETIQTSGAAQIIAEHSHGEQPIVISGVPDKWIDCFHSHGFREYARFQDYWLDKITQHCTGTQYSDYTFLDANECAAASAVTIACRGQSRGFEGETPEWFDSWLRGSEDGQINTGCNNPAVLVQKKDGKVIGVSCTATYAHHSEKGAVVWIRELAVLPEYQGQGVVCIKNSLPSMLLVILHALNRGQDIPIWRAGYAGA